MRLCSYINEFSIFYFDSALHHKQTENKATTQKSNKQNVNLATINEKPKLPTFRSVVGLDKIYIFF